MATTAAAAKAPAVAAPEAAPKKKSKLVLIIILATALLAAGAGGAWYFMVYSAADDEQPRVSSKPPVFLPVEQFTVNLQPEEGQQFLQVAMTLKVVDQDTADAIKALLPEVRSRVLLLLSSKKPSQILTLEGKTALADAIAREVEAPLPADKARAPKKTKEDPTAKATKKAKGNAKAQEAAPNESAPQRVLAVFFTHFIIQ